MAGEEDFFLRIASAVVRRTAQPAAVVGAEAGVRVGGVDAVAAQNGAGASADGDGIHVGREHASRGAHGAG